MVSTVLIIYRIYSVTRKNVMIRGGSRYTHILDLLVQSDALYVFGSLLLAIPLVLPVTNTSEVRVLTAQYYSGSIFPFTAVSDYFHHLSMILMDSKGVAPTLMVARLALGTSRNAGRSVQSAHISEIQFHATSAISASSGDRQVYSPPKDQEGP
ncbi:hypothetical protein HYPSUDRAFT_202270 [Hypholoma sublateritium FD-334 SS-4]|uniref:Uncharacterized protein n=1 Tax=Hypholoma sublateritium (strain FD-334 SS-4) TaxID=945553 RepID=A0A0D2P0M0_HYPSF|nr:hypothetical protein HYPSUDRAFT_202270 [Hypholoma sublateritium FD-334 SS-4]